ncbi:hypothetical protein, partial [Enterobacter hormaechei]|uniref:hypothetical protein n=1 Tax=Enterobacter hormaechei TaxID=158836 RepID=UPI00203BEE06
SWTSSTGAGSGTRPAIETTPGCGLPWVESTVSRLSRGARGLLHMAEEQPTDSRLYHAPSALGPRPAAGSRPCLPWVE